MFPSQTAEALTKLQEAVSAIHLGEVGPAEAQRLLEILQRAVVRFLAANGMHGLGAYGANIVSVRPTP